MTEAQRILWYLSAGAQFALAIYFCVSGLRRQYPAFTLFLVAAPLRSLALIWAGYHTTHYWWIWVATEILILGLQWFFVLEIYGACMRGYRTERGELVYVLCGALAIATAISFGATVFEHARYQWDAYAQPAMTFRRHVLSILVAFLVVIKIHCFYFPARTSPNLHFHRTIALWYFAQAALAQFVVTMGGPKIIIPANIAALSASIMCFVAWGWFMRPSRQHIEQRQALPGEVEALERMAAQINDFMRKHPPGR